MQSLVIPALPTIQRELGTSAAGTSWAVTAFLLSASVATPLAGRLGDLRGKRPVLIGVLLSVVAGTLLCAAVPTVEGLIGGRLLQGVGGGAMPLAYAIVRDELDPRRVSHGIALMSSLLGVGGALGVVVAGVVVQSHSYVWLFWLQLPIFVAVTWGVRRWIPDSPVGARTPIDWSGAALMSTGLLLLLLTITQAASWGVAAPGTLAVAVGAVVLLGAWLRAGVRHPDPIVDLRLLRLRAGWTVNLAAVLVGVAQFTSFIMLPQYVQEPASNGYGFGASALGSAVFLLPMTVVMVLVGTQVGRLERRIGLRGVLLLGVGATAAAFSLFVFARAEPWEVYLGSGLLGGGLGICIAAVTALAVLAVAPEQTGVAAGVNNVARTIGGALGGQLAAALLTVGALADGGPSFGGYTLAFAVGLIGLAGIALLAPLLPDGGPRRPLPQAAAVRGPSAP